MKCTKCSKKVEDEYAKVPKSPNSNEQVDYGAGAENVKTNRAFLYYHRECYKQVILEANKIGSTTS